MTVHNMRQNEKYGSPIAFLKANRDRRGGCKIYSTYFVTLSLISLLNHLRRCVAACDICVLVYGLKPKRLRSTVRPTAYLTYSIIAQIRILLLLTSVAQLLINAFTGRGYSPSEATTFQSGGRGYFPPEA